MSLGSLIHPITQFDHSFFLCNQPLFSGHQSIFRCHQSLFNMVYYYEGVANLTEEEGAQEKAFYTSANNGVTKCKPQVVFQGKVQ